MRRISLFILLGMLLNTSPVLKAQSSIFVRNNSWLDFQVWVSQTGTHNLASSEWSKLANRQEPWWVDQELVVTDRDNAAIPNGDTVYFNLSLKSGLDSLSFKFRLIGNANGSNLEYSAAGPGFSDPWSSDGSFHQNTTNLGGRNLTIKYQAKNGDGNQSRDLLFVIHEDEPYEIDSTDFGNPNLINVMAYNIQMLPLGVVGLPDADLRGDLMPASLSPWQDVVIFAEAFDPLPRDNKLKPAMQAQGFGYNSGILNNYFPFNGGIIIFSRWPIEKTDEYDFALCGPNSGDCFANKGIMYARINKLGKKYHIFGTHMDAGSDPQDLLAKNLQMAEMRDFIAAQNIPDNEAVLYGGDFNVSPISGNNLYANMQDSLDPIIPYPIGYHCSTMNTDTAKIIDHIWGCRKHLVPLHATNKVMSLRSIHDDMWELSEFSDHRSVIARYIYPDISGFGTDTVICPGDGLNFSVNSNIPLDYSWSQNGNPISGAASSNYSVVNASTSDDGNYIAEVRYEVVYGDSNDILTPFFFPNGPDTVQAVIDLSFGQLTVDSVLCSLGIGPDLAGGMYFWPNPSEGKVWLEVRDFLAEGKVELWSVEGRLLRQWEIHSEQMELDLQGISSGIYLLRVSGNRQEGIGKLLIKN